MKYWYMIVNEIFADRILIFKGLIPGRRMVAKNPKKIWNERNIWKTHTKYGEDGMTEIQHTVSSVEME